MTGIELRSYTRDGWEALRIAGGARARLRKMYVSGTTMVEKDAWWLTALEVVELDPQSFTAVQIVEEGFVREFCSCGVLMSKVYKIRAVWHDVTEKVLDGERETWVYGSRILNLMESYLCSTHKALNCTRCSSCNGGFSHFRCDLRNKAKALPLRQEENVSGSVW
jgi:hypothetical protein